MVSPGVQDALMPDSDLYLMGAPVPPGGIAWGLVPAFSQGTHKTSPPASGAYHLLHGSWS